MAVKYGFEYFETSAKTGDNVDRVFESMTNKVLKAIESGSIDPTQEVISYNIEQVYGIKIGALTAKKRKDGEMSLETQTQKISPQSETKKEGCC